MVALNVPSLVPPVIRREFRGGPPRPFGCSIGRKVSIFAAVGFTLRARTAQDFRRARTRLQTWAVRALREILAGLDMNYSLDMNFSFEFFVQKSKPLVSQSRHVASKQPPTFQTPFLSSSTHASPAPAGKQREKGKQWPTSETRVYVQICFYATSFD